MGGKHKKDPNNKVDPKQLQDPARRRALAALGVSSLVLAGPAFVTLADGFLNAAEAEEKKSGKKGSKKSGKQGHKKSGKKGGKKGKHHGKGRKDHYAFSPNLGSGSGPWTLEGGRYIDCSRSDLLRLDELLCRIFDR